jgi:hypothetical protein
MVTGTLYFKNCHGTKRIIDQKRLMVKWKRRRMTFGIIGL